MSDKIPAEIASILTEFVEKVGLLRRDMQQKKELEKYEARMQRIEQKLSALAERVSARRSGSGEGDADRVADAGPQPRVPERRASKGSERVVRRARASDRQRQSFGPTV